MGDTFIWRYGHAGAWNDPSNWWRLPGAGSVEDLGGALYDPRRAPADRAPDAGDDVLIPALSTLAGPITGGGEADTVLLQGDGNAVTLAGTGTEHYAFRELFLGVGGSNLVLSDARLDTQEAHVPGYGFLDVSQGAVGTDLDGRPTTASLGLLVLEATPGPEGRAPVPPYGRLILGDRDVGITSLVQGGLGVGNAFDPRVGIVGTGELRYPPGDLPPVPYVTTPFTPFAPPDFGLDLPPPLESLDFGEVAVGDTATRSFTVANIAAAAQRPLIGAVQTAANGGQVTDPALSGGGVTPGNFYLPADVSRQDFTVTLTGDAPHGLEGQAVHIAFADGRGVTLPITGAVVEAGCPAADWNALAAEAVAHFAATGQWFVDDAPCAATPGDTGWDALAAEVAANFARTGQWFA